MGVGCVSSLIDVFCAAYNIFKCLRKRFEGVVFFTLLLL